MAQGPLVTVAPAVLDIVLDVDDEVRFPVT